MAISDDDLVRQLESMPLVDPPDFREAVMARVRRAPAHRHTPAKSRHFGLALAFAAAMAIVVGIAFWRAPEPKPQNAAATMVSPRPELTVNPISSDRWSVKANVSGRIEFDQTKFSLVETRPDGTLILQRNPGASGAAEIRLLVSGNEVVKASVAVN